MPPTSAKTDKLAEILSSAFGKAAFRVDRSKPLTFVCGGNNDNGTVALRNQFLDEIKKAPPRIVPVLAEKAFPHQLIEQNLLRFEEFLGSTADCVLIFVESVGSFAETGLFAALKSVLPKTLVVNTRQEALKNSFLNLGPIKLIRKSSRFETIVDLDEKRVTTADSEFIVEAILRTYPKFENALVFHPENKFSDLDLRLQLACVHIAVTLMHAGSKDLVTSVLRNRFKSVSAEAIERYLSVLTSINALDRDDELYFNPNRNALIGDLLVYSADFSVENVRARALEWQAENDSHVATFLRERRGIGI